MTIRFFSTLFALTAIALAQTPDINKPIHTAPVQSVTNLLSNEAHGIATSIDFTAEQGTSWEGGVHVSVAHALTRTNVTLDTATALKIPAGILHFTVGSYAGHSFSKGTDSPQPTSSIDGLRGTKALEWWWEQSYHGKHLRVRAGRMDANAIFAGSDVASGAMNGAFGYSPTISPMPSYPDTQVGVVAISQIGHQEFAVGTFHASGGGAVTIGQGSRKWGKPGYEGQASVGVWRGHERPNCSRMPSGIYGVASQTMWSDANSGRDLKAFMLWGRAAGSDVDADKHLALGMQYEGVPGRKKDSILVGVSRVHRAAGNTVHPKSHTVAETMYVAQLTNRFAWGPDLQIMTNHMGQRSVVVAQRLVITIGKN